MPGRRPAMRAPVLPVVLSLLVPGPWAASGAGAQTPRELLIQDWERHREVVLAYVDAMPEEHLGFRPTPGVRTFAEQIEHIVTDNVSIVATAFGRDDRPDLGDPDRYLSEQESLRAHVRAGYDFVLTVIREASDEELAAPGEVFGRYRVPRWRALEGAREHATWTLGQTVPYLRLNGIQPPAYQVFPLSTIIEGRGDPRSHSMKPEFSGSG